MTSLTVLDDASISTVGASTDGDHVTLDAADLAASSGWELKPAGLCRDDVCVPVRDRAALVRDGGLDADEFARLTGRVAVVDAERGIVAFGRSGPQRSEAMATLVAPDFTLPDIDGNPVSLHDFGRRKRLLLAWSSW